MLRIPGLNTGISQDIQKFLEDSNSHNIDDTKASLQILKYKDKINSEIKKEWLKISEFKYNYNAGKSSSENVNLINQELNHQEYTEKQHSINFKLIEEDIKIRNEYLYYLIGIYVQIGNIESEIETYKKEFVKVQSEKYTYKEGEAPEKGYSKMCSTYENVLSNYQFGLANQEELKSFSSINTSLKYMRKLFSKSNKAVVSKELFENLTNEQKRDLKSFMKMRFSKLVNDKTIVSYNRMPQLKSIISNLRIIFFEDEDYNVQAQVIYKEKPRTAICGRAIMKMKTSILVSLIFIFCV
jgi:hypothetical protein